MDRTYSIADARANLSELVREAEDGVEIAITRRGKRVAVLVGQDSYTRLRGEGRDFGAAYLAFKKESGLEGLDLDVEEIFGDVRDRSSGREVDL